MKGKITRSDHMGWIRVGFADRVSFCSSSLHFGGARGCTDTERVVVNPDHPPPLMAAALLRRRNPTPVLLRLFSTTTSSRLPSPDELKALIRSDPSPESIADLFDQTTPHPAFHSDRELYSLTVTKLHRARRPDLITRVLSSQLSHPATPKSEGFLVRILSLFSSAALPDHALRTFLLIPSPRSERSLSALLTAFLHNNQPQLLRDTLLTAADTHSVTPTVISYNILLKSLCLSDIAEARELLDEMPTKGVKPNIQSYNTLLTGYFTDGDDDGVDEILDLISKRGLKRSVVTFTYGIMSLCRRGRVAEAEELLDAMEKVDVRPSRVCFNTLIDGFCKDRDVGSAMRVLKRMGGEEEVKPNFDTYSPLLTLLVEEGEFSSALEICNKCLDRKWVPAFNVVKGLIVGLVEGSHVDEAKEVAAKMKGAQSGIAVESWQKVEAVLPL